MSRSRELGVAVSEAIRRGMSSRAQRGDLSPSMVRSLALLGTTQRSDHHGPAGLVITCGHLFDDRPEKLVLFVETALILRQQTVEVMKGHRIKDSPLRMSRAIHARQGGRMASRNEPSSWTRPRLPEGKARTPSQRSESEHEADSRSWYPTRKTKTTSDGKPRPLFSAFCPRYGQFFFHNTDILFVNRLFRISYNCNSIHFLYAASPSCFLLFTRRKA
jgi:hypothetical protein